MRHKKRKSFSWVLFVVLVVVALGAYSQRQRLSAITAGATTTIMSPQTDQSIQTIRLATWNIQNLGKSKVNNAAIMKTIGEVLSKYDVVALQEISNVDEEVDSGCARNQDACPGDMCHLVRNAILREVQKSGRNYSLVMSPQVKDERYAVLFDTNKVAVRGNAFIVEDLGESLPFCDAQQSIAGKMLRQPFVVPLRAGNLNFTLMTAHTSPANNLVELDGLGFFFEQQLAKDANTILLGDLNADCSYLSSSDEITLRAFTWLIPDDMDTTVGSTSCAYDRIIIKNEFDRFTGRIGIHPDITADISDHALVWAELKVE